MFRYPIVVAEAEARPIALRHPQTEIKQRDPKIYVVQREEILPHQGVLANHYNQSVYSVSLNSHTTKTGNKIPPNCLPNIKWQWLHI